jgi:hypothetical protein
MERSESLNPPAYRPGGNSQTEALEELGGEPLIGSGFEAEQPEMTFDESR